jgi:predicted metal-dependent hydrolase
MSLTAINGGTFTGLSYALLFIVRGLRRFMDSRDKERLFRIGLEAFNSGHFYDAHEHWEEVWLETPNPEKMFLQGLIQVAAAFHHYSKANRLGTQKLLQAGLTKIEPFPHVHRRLELETLRAAVRRWLAALEAGETPAKSEIPHIKCHDGGRSSA